MIKIIIALRNPIERAYSHWNMMREQKRDTLSFWDALQNESERCREALPYQHRFYSYVDRGFYVAQLRRLWSYFPRENTLVLKQGSLKKNPGETLDTVFGFLGVDRVPGLDIIDIHSRPYMAPLSDRAFEHLRYTYEYEICTLERILGWDCRDWLIKGSSNSSGHG